MLWTTLLFHFIKKSLQSSCTAWTTKRYFNGSTHCTPWMTKCPCNHFFHSYSSTSFLVHSSCDDLENIFFSTLSFYSVHPLLQDQRISLMIINSEIDLTAELPAPSPIKSFVQIMIYCCQSSLTPGVDTGISLYSITTSTLIFHVSTFITLQYIALAPANIAYLYTTV